MGLWHGGGHSPVALVGDEDEGSGLGDDEVRAGDAHVGLDELVAEFAPGGVCELFDAGVGVGSQSLVEEGVHVGLGHVNGGDDDVVGRLSRELDEVFAEVGLDGLDLLFGELAVEVHFLGEHGLALDDGTDALLPGEVEDVLGGGVGVLGEEDLAARALDVFGGHVEVVVEVFYGVGLDAPGAVAEAFPVGGCGGLFEAALIEAAVEGLEVLLYGGVAKGVGGE